MTTTDIFNISPVTYCWLPDYNPNKKKINDQSDEKINRIRQIIQDWSGYTIADLSKKNRKRDLVKARQVAMYLLKYNTSLTLTTIGRMFKKRDHSTPIHSIQTVMNLMATDKEYREEILRLEKRITGVLTYDTPQHEDLPEKPVLKIIHHVPYYSNQKSLYK